MKEIIYLLEQTDIFDGLTPEQLEQVAQLGQPLFHRAGEVIFQEGAHSDELYLILEGEVDILMDPSVVSGDRPEKQALITVATLRRGQCFGEMALVDQGMRSATARAAQSPTRLLMIPKERLIALCESEPSLGYRVMRNLAADLALKMRNTGFSLRQFLRHS